MKSTVTLLCCLAMLLAGCATSISNANPRTGHHTSTLQWGIVGSSDVPTLDPALASDSTSISVVSLVYGGLVRLDQHLKVVPDGARSWTISRDGRTYTFHIRPNLRFSSGKRVTASDFAMALNRALGPDGAAGAASFYLGSIARTGATGTRAITVLGPSTLRITLSRPSAHFLAQLAFPSAFVPDPATVARYGANWTDHAAGFGPYRVVSWQHTRSLVLQRNPYYWAGIPTFRRIKVHLYQGHAALAAYAKGTLDLVSGAPAGQDVFGSAVGLRRVAALSLDYLAFNTTRLPFLRLNARRAFAAASQSTVVNRNLRDTAVAVNGYLPSTFGIRTPSWQATHSPSTYLARARYPHGRGLTSIVLVAPADPRIAPLIEGIARRWRAVLNTQVVVRQLDPSIYDRVLSAHAFDVALVRWGADYADPQDFLGTQLGTSGGNVTGWQA
ncbi:MAG: ABC transporter substrate-binding protein, partial [Chloroflexota bacterium]